MPLTQVQSVFKKAPLLLNNTITQYLGQYSHIPSFLSIQKLWQNTSEKS